MRATVHIDLRDADGRIVGSRFARNSVMRGGASLIANLFAGGQAPTWKMGVGVNDEPESDAFDSTGLTAPGEADDALEGGTEVDIPAENFSVELDTEKRVALVTVRATMPHEAAVGKVREAGLIASTGNGDVLYNRVTFAPIDKRNDHELTLFWEVTFPYGDLHALF